MASLSAAASLRLHNVSTAPSPGGQDGEFISFKATMRLPIAPIFGSKGDNSFPGHDGGMDGVREVLAGWVMRYLPPIRAVLLSFSPTPRFLHPSASFPSSASPFDSVSSNPLKNPSGYLASPPPEGEDEAEGEAVTLKTLPMVEGSGFTLAMVEWEGVGWRPRVGMKLVGTPTLSTPSHISLLLHNLFNASIPSSHIPLTDYVFDPECDVPAVVTERRNAAVPLKSLTEQVRAKAEGEVEKVEEKEENGEVKEESAEEEEEKKVEEEEEDEEELYQEKGWWVHQKTREPLGGKEGRIEFTLVGLATSNSLLSCTGSLLPDPFSPSALAALKQPIPASSSFAPSAPSALQKQSKKRGFDSDNDTGSSSESDTDDDDDDRIGTGIPANGGDAKKGAPPTVRDATASADEEESSESERESSRSPSPASAPVPVPAKKGKKEKAAKKDKKDKKPDGRKSKKVKTGP
ncbi:hypothetical protein JCM6882_008502 [Rhodosporidiobolus microsporus]